MLRGSIHKVPVVDMIQVLHVERRQFGEFAFRGLPGAIHKNDQSQQAFFVNLRAQKLSDLGLRQIPKLPGHAPRIGYAHENEPILFPVAGVTWVNDRRASIWPPGQLAQSGAGLLGRRRHQSTSPLLKIRSAELMSRWDEA